MSDTDGLDAMERALVHARAARGWRRQEFPERSNKHVRDMLDALAAAAGKLEWKIDDSEIVAEVERREDTEHADANGAVHPQQIADGIGRHHDPIRRRCGDLADAGELVKCWDIGPRGPRESYRIASDGDEEAADAPGEDSGPRRRRWVG